MVTPDQGPSSQHHTDIRKIHYPRVVWTCATAIQRLSPSFVASLRPEIDFALGSEHKFVFSHPRAILNMDPLWPQRAWRIFSAAVVRAFGHAYGHNDFHKYPRFKLIEYALSRSSIRSKLFGLFTDKIKYVYDAKLQTSLVRKAVGIYDPDINEHLHADAFMAFLACSHQQSPSGTHFWLVRLLYPIIDHVCETNLDLCRLFTEEVPLRALSRHYAAPGDPNYELYCPPTYALDIPRLLSSPSLRWALDMPGPLVTMNKDLLQVQASASLPMVAHGLGRRAMASFIPHPPFGPTEERVLKRKRGDGGGHAGQASPPATLDGSSQPPSRKRRRDA